MRATIRRVLIAGAVCLGFVYVLAGGSQASRTGAAPKSHPSLAGADPVPPAALAARLGIAELTGSGGHSIVSWNSRTGLWGGHIKANWWQSALAILTIVRYAERTDSRDPVYQHILLRTYRRNLFKPHSTARRDFANEFMDDTGWWGLAWLEASRYERYVRHDGADAARFLAVAEWDARYIASQHRPCGGIVWALRRPPDTITSAEFIALTAELSIYRDRPGAFHDPRLAAVWRADALGALGWLERTGLINLRTGSVLNGVNGACRRIGGSMSYTEGEVAEALVALGTAFHEPSYYREAAAFLRYAISPASGLIAHGVLQERCEAQHGGCARLHYRLDIPAYKGLFVDAVSDWSKATGSDEFRRFLRAQATAVLNDAIQPSPIGAPACSTPQSCQFRLAWMPHPGTPSVGVTVGGQESALDALTAVLPRRS